ncbi:hypothetical protein HUU05_23940, partial [candidate division KSB1 bacterium]|nr:hypothetical protein [candidate division KSB1 bacterium]
QQEIVDNYVKELQKHFPEIEVIEVVESPEGKDTLWILVTNPQSEEREIELFEFKGKKGIDILDDYGYHILVQPTMNGHGVPA